MTNHAHIFPAFPHFLLYLPLPRKYVEAQGNQFAQSKDNLVYLGAYTLDDWDVAGNTIKLKKNPDYWDANSVNVDEIDFQVIPDAQQGVMSYENGNLDRVVISGNLASQYATNPEFSSTLGVFNWYLEFNEDEVPDEKLRQAIGYAIDNEDIATNVLKDGSIPQYNILMSGLYFNKSGEDFNDACPDHFQYNPDKAKELWKEAQKETSQKTLTILYESDNTTIENVAAYIQNSIESTLDGFTVELETLPKKNRLDRMEKGDFQAALHRWGPDFADPACIMSLYTSDSPYNYGHFSDSTYDELVKSCDSTLATDPEARWEAYQKAENILGESGSVIPLFQLADAALTKSNVHGITNHVSGVACWYKYVNLD